MTGGRRKENESIRPVSVEHNITNEKAKDAVQHLHGHLKPLAETC